MALRQTTELLIILAFSIQIILGQEQKTRYFCFTGVKLPFRAWNDFCRARGQWMVMPTSINLMRQIRPPPGRYGNFWIGAQKTGYRIFTYQDGKQLPRHLWNGVEPNNNQDCSAMGNNGYLYDDSCTGRPHNIWYSACQDREESTDEMIWSREWSSWA